eukprot:5994871-Prymnesium_polylepis.1
MAAQGNNRQAAAVNNAPCDRLQRVCLAESYKANSMRCMAFALKRENEQLRRQNEIRADRDERINAPRVDLRAVRDRGLEVAAAPPDRPRSSVTLSVFEELGLKLKVLGAELVRCEATEIDTNAAAECNNKADGLADGGAETEEGAETLPTAQQLAANK